MISGEVWNEINALYGQLEMKRNEIADALKREGFDVTVGWFNDHYVKTPDGEWVREAFPIPLITVKGLCDIEIQFDGISVTSRMKRDDALLFDYEKLLAYEFEAYGAEEYLSDYYHPGQTLRELKDAIVRSREREIGFSFAFPFAAGEEQILEVCRLLSCESFFY